MCTILLRLAPGAAEPVVLAANRDEFRDRATDEPHPVAPGVFAGRDRFAGGTWLAVSARGVAALTNIAGGARQPDARSRGTLPLAALRGTLPADLGPFGPFNLVVVDGDGARLLSRLPDGRVLGPVPLPPGDHVLANEPPGAPPSPRAQRARALLRLGPPGFRALADHGEPPGDGLCHHGATYGTVSSTVIVLDAGLGLARYLHRPGLPCRTPTRDLTAEARAAIAATRLGA